MTYEELKDAYPATRERMPAIVAALNELTQAGWSIVQEEKDYDRLPMIRDAQGCPLAFRLDDRSKTPALTVYTPMMRYTNGETYTQRSADKVPSVNIGLSKTDAQIARDIERRILQQWIGVWEGIRDDIEAHAGRCYVARFDAELLANALNGKIVDHGHGHPDTPRLEYVVRLKDRHDLKLYNRRVTFELTLPVNEAIALLSELKDTKEG